MPIAFVLALLAGSLIFWNRPPRTQTHLERLSHLGSMLRQTFPFPEKTAGKIRVEGLSEDHAIWLRYFAAPQAFALLPPKPGDTVLVLSSSRATAPALLKNFWHMEDDSFRIALGIQP